MEEQVKSALTFLLQSHIPTATARDIDEIVLSYVMGILEDLVEESDPSQAFDSDSFMEMIVAYLPQLEGVDETNIAEWMIKLASDIKSSKEEKSSSSFDLKSLIEKTTNQPKKCRTASESSQPELGTKRTSEAGSSEEAEIEAGVARLLEMFPSCSKVEAVHCLTIKGGDLEMAAQMILNRMEMGEDIKLSQAQLLAQLSKPVTIDESEIKRKIMDNYGFVDTENDRKYHRPRVNRKGQEEKKMIRYREGKIVSTKGERFSQVTKEESEEMKKSIIGRNGSPLETSKQRNNSRRRKISIL